MRPPFVMGAFFMVTIQAFLTMIHFESAVFKMKVKCHLKCRRIKTVRFSIARPERNSDFRAEISSFRQDIRIEFGTNKKQVIMKKFIALGLIATMGIVVQSCKKDEATANPGTMGTMKVKMTDDPANYAALNMEITKVEAFSEQSGWITLNSQSQMVSVLSLTNGTETILANTAVSAGVYSKLRITFGSANTLTLNAESGGNTCNLGFGSNLNHQVEIEIDEQVESNSTAEILIDFNVAGSIIGSGTTYFINPIMEIIEDAGTGVKGDVDGENFAHVTVWNQSDSVNCYTNFQGKFLIRGLDAGTYDLKVKTCGNQGEINSVTLTGITVTDGEIEDVGTIQME